MSSFGRRGIGPRWKRLGCRIYGDARIRASSCRDAGKQLSAIGLMDFEDLIIRRLSPLVAGEIAIFLHVHLRGLHDSQPPLFLIEVSGISVTSRRDQQAGGTTANSSSQRSGS